MIQEFFQLLSFIIVHSSFHFGEEGECRKTSARMHAASDDAATDSCPAAARAALETNARFISCLLNEGLLQCDPAVRPDMPTAMAEPGIRLRSPKRGGVESNQELWISTTRQQHGARELWHQADFGTPILARSPEGRETDGWAAVSSPVELAGRARRMMSEAVDDTAWAGAVDQLDSSFRNMSESGDRTSV
jgi:hypothetical protein